VTSLSPAFFDATPPKVRDCINDSRPQNHGAVSLVSRPGFNIADPRRADLRPLLTLAAGVAQWAT
jgi:hypothetical protein